MSHSTSTAYLGLGANIGDRTATLRAAVGALADHPDVHLDLAVDLASLFETSPVGGPHDQPAFLNSVVRVRTSLEPLPLLDLALEIETRFGRVRGEAWGPRSIDIDLLLYDDLVLESDRLTLPHPHLHERAFVLEPLQEVAATLRHPVLGRAIEHLAEEGKSDSEVVRILGRTWCTDAILPGAGLAD